MAIRDAWKILKPEEQLLQVVREVRRINDRLRTYTKIRGVRLEGRLVGGERRLFAVIDDPTASNDGQAYQLVP